MRPASWFRVDVVVVLVVWGALALVTAQGGLGRYAPSGQVEVAAVLFSALSVWLAVNNSVLTWPTGIVGTALYLYLFGEWRLFADAGLQAVYIALGVVGMWSWRRRASAPSAAQAERASTHDDSEGWARHRQPAGNSARHGV